MTEAEFIILYFTIVILGSIFFALRYMAYRKYKPTNKYKKGQIVIGSDGKKYRCIGDV